MTTKANDALVKVWDNIMEFTRNHDLSCPFCDSAGDHDDDCSVPYVREALTGDFTYAPTDLEDCGE